MSWIESSIAFLSGAFSIAVVNQIVSRFFGAPRTDVAIADISLARTKHRGYKSIPISDELRALLSDGPTQRISWDETAMSEYGIDLSILEIHERENTHSSVKEILEQKLSVISKSNIRDQVLSIGRNPPLIFICVNGLIRFTHEAPAIPPEDMQPETVLGIHVISRVEKGRQKEFVHLDVPGNPYPIVGDASGRPEINKKVASLAYALSRCDHNVLGEIFKLAIRYCETRIDHAKRLREKLEKIKREKCYIEVQLLVTNRMGATLRIVAL